MTTIIGFVIVFGAVFGGFIMHGGKIAALIQISEFVIIGGAGLGALVASNPPSVISAIIKGVMGLMKGSPYSKKETFLELLQALFALFTLARKEGLLALEQHVERPQESSLFQQYPFLLSNHHALDFLCDTMKVVLTGAVGAFELAELTETDLEKHHEEVMRPSHALAKSATRCQASESSRRCWASSSRWATWIRVPRPSGTRSPPRWWAPFWAFCWRMACSSRWQPRWSITRTRRRSITSAYGRR
jgi:flagellar motor component MotA